MGDKELMCVIGFGRMGKRVTLIFSRGFSVKVVSRRDIVEEVTTCGAILADNPDDAISEADFIFLTLPVDAIRSWVPRINKSSLAHCIVMDCCTARVAAEKELGKLKRERFGIPEIGPGRVPVIGNPDKRIADYLKKQGCFLQPATAEEYDRANASVGIAHFLGMALDFYLDDSQRNRLEKAQSGTYLLKLIEHLKKNSTTTYRETQLLNPYMGEARKKLISALQNTDQELDNGTFRFESFPRDKWRL